MTWKTPLAILALMVAGSWGLTVYDFSTKDIDGNPVKLGERYRGKVLLIVNVATYWGLTDQNYKQLQALYVKHEAEGFRIAGFPCNQFGQQENGTNAEIKERVMKKYSPTFDLYHKINVNDNSTIGIHAMPLYNYLKKKMGGGWDIRWNFAKFLINRHGVPINRYDPKVDPFAIEDDIVQELKKKSSGTACWIIEN